MLVASEEDVSFEEAEGEDVAKEDLSEEEGEITEEIDEAEEIEMGAAADLTAADGADDAAETDTAGTADSAADTAADTASTGRDIVECSSSATVSSSITGQGHVEN